MSTQQLMFAAIEQWKQSGQSKAEFLIGKPYNHHKFNYWLGKLKAMRNNIGGDGFEPIPWTGSKSEKLFEMVTASGMKITVFG